MSSDQFATISPPASSATPVRVVLVDDHAPTLVAISRLLEKEHPRIEVVGVAKNGETVLRVTTEARPDVIVLDIDLDGENGLDLIPAIRSRLDVAVVIFTSSDDAEERCRARQVGVDAFVSKFAPAEELISAIIASPRRGWGLGLLS